MNFLEVMEKRHSSRDFKKDEVSEDTLREIVKIAGMSPSWENSQPWNVYIATGETLEKIRETWIAENDQKIKGSADMDPGHRTNFSERGQKNMADFMDAIGNFWLSVRIRYFCRQASSTCSRSFSSSSLPVPSSPLKQRISQGCTLRARQIGARYFIRAPRLILSALVAMTENGIPELRRKRFIVISSSVGSCRISTRHSTCFSSSA